MLQVQLSGDREFEILDIVNTSVGFTNRRARSNSGTSRTLKLSLSGSVYAMEYKPCGQLNVDLVGSRIVIRDAAVRHGVILLEPRHIVSISKHTDEQEQQQEKEEEEKVHVEQVCDDIDLQVEGVVVDHAVVVKQTTMMPRVLVLVFVLLLASTCHGLNIGYVSNIDELQHFTTTHKLDRFTHIVVGGAALDAISLTVKFKTGNDLKLPSFSGKWLMGILGKGEGTVLSDFSKMALSKESRSKFIKSAIETAKQNGFEGVEIQWLFPAHPSYNGGVDDRLNFALLLQEFRIEIRNSKQKDFLLSAAGSAQAFSQNYGLRSGYAVKAVAAAVDWISIMGFDLAGPLYNHRTTHYSPLYRYSQSSALEEKIITAREAETLNVCGIADAVETWIELGAAPEKLVLVLPAFGKLWKLKFNQVIGLGAPSIPVKDESMLELDQSQISSFLKNPSTIVTSDSRIVSKYAVSSEYKMWLSYEDVQTISVKAAFAAEKKLGGIMIWSVEKDNDPSSLISDKAFDIFSSSASKWLSQYSQENQILKNSCTWGSLCKYLSGSDFTLQIMALVTVGLSMLLTSAIYVYQSPNDEDHSNDYAAIPEKAEVRSSAAELVERKDRRADKISPPFPEAGKISEHYTKISETPIESQQTRFASPGPRRKSNQ